MTTNNSFQPLTDEQRKYLSARCRELISMKAELQGVPNKEYVTIFRHFATRTLGALAQGVANREEGKHFTVTVFINATDEVLSAGMGADAEGFSSDEDFGCAANLLTAARAAYHSSGVIARTTEPDGSMSVRAWKLVDGHPLPLPANVAAQMDDAPAPGNTYIDAFDIAPLLFRMG